MTRIERILCPNPGPYTGPGTNTYLIGTESNLVVVDPGPVIPSHLDAVVAAIGDTTVAAVAVTHTHPDHAPGANPLGERLDVPVLGYAPGPAFSPDRQLGDGDSIKLGDEETIVAVHTPGHAADHLCFAIGDVLFTGDHIMGGSTVVIEDAAAYMASLQRVLDLGPATLYPGHGERIDDAEAAVRGYIAHRKRREDEVVAAVGDGASTVSDIVDAVYAGLDPALRLAAEYQVRVQLTKLQADGRVQLGPSITPTDD